MPRKTLIIGCGYVGFPLAFGLREYGDLVTGWVHSQESADALQEYQLHRIIIGSVGKDEIWNEIGESYDVVIHCASSGRGGIAAYEEVFLRGARNMARYQPQARMLFVSSTSVYGQIHGEEVTEDSATDPASATSRILLQAETEARAAGATAVRSSGIYGPERGALFEQFVRGEAVIKGNGLRWINQIHRDDLVEALFHLIDKGEPGEIYNATDGTPVTQRDFYAWCSEFLQKPFPPEGPIDIEHKRGLTNKRVSNAKLCATGWTPHYPSFREGIAAGI